jgi:phospholipase/lecithinase/hemolysin
LQSDIKLWRMEKHQARLHLVRFITFFTKFRHANRTSGDSYTTTGFNTSLTQPAPGNPLGNPAYPGWTAANGPNWADFLTVKYNNSLILTYNLAYGGATVDSALVAPYLPTVQSLAQQIENWWFPNYAEQTNAAWTSEDSIFAIFIGINDVGNSWWQDRVINKKIFAVYGGLLEMLYNAGAKNFVLLNVPPVDRSPLTLAQTAENQASEKADITAFNSAVADLAKSVKKAHGDVNVFTVDTNKVFTQVLDKPSSYKATALYKNTTAFCDAYAK